MSIRPELDPALARCVEITQRRPTHLARAVAGLEDPRRRALFLASYASMRVADDLVDEEFMALPAAERAGARPRVETTLARWLDQVEAAALGRFRPREDSIEPELFTALSRELEPTELGSAAWRELAVSLRRDIAEERIGSWQDFLVYCRGACIAPASVFVYIVGAVFDRDGRSHFPSKRDPSSYAEELAVYSYLVHLRRDLVEDAHRDPQLVLLPREWIADCGLSEAEAMTALKLGRMEALDGALDRLAEQTESYRKRAMISLDRAESDLGAEAALSLRSIFRLYEATATRT